MALAARPDFEHDEGQQEIAMHLLQVEMAILARRWDALSPLRRRLDIKGRR